MMGEEEVLLRLPAAISVFLSSEIIYCFIRKENQKKKFPHDIGWFVLRSENKIISLRDALSNTCFQPDSSS